MNSARLAHSQRLDKVFRVLLDGNPHTTMDLIRRANVCAVNSIISELRDNGIKITCQRTGRLWYYQLQNGGKNGTH